MHVIEYKPEHKGAATELMAELQDCERVLSSDRTPGSSMAADHLDYLLKLCRAQSGKVFLALKETEVVGFVVVFLEAEDEEDRHLFPEFKRYGWISDLIVAPEHRSLGAASLLLDCAERHCSSLGVRQVKLAALHGNQRARRFYERSGYRKYEVVYSKGI